MTINEFKLSYKEFLTKVTKHSYNSANKYVSYINKACLLPGMNDLWYKLSSTNDSNARSHYVEQLCGAITEAFSDPMGKLNPNKIYINLGEVILKFSYRDFIYFLYNLGMDYYDGLQIISDEDWHDILIALKENYVQYEVEKKIKYKEFRANMATFLNTKFYKHKHAYEVMTDAMTSFGQGNNAAKLKYLISDFEEQEKFKQECDTK